MYARRVGDRELTFDFAEGLLDDNLLVVDRETGSVWSQLEGQAISGPLQGTPLTMVPALQTTWKHWRERHPETLVLVEPGKEGRPYLYRNRTPGTPRPSNRPTTHDTTTLGLGLVIGDDAILFPLAAMKGTASPLTVTVGGQTVRIYHRTDDYTAWAEDTDGRLLTAVLVYASGWKSFFSETRIWSASVEP